MKLFIEQVDGDGASCRGVQIWDDRGEQVKGVRGVTIKHRTNEPAWVTVDFVVNGQSVAFGRPPEPEPADEISLEALWRLIVKTMPGDALTHACFDHSVAWDGYAFNWMGEQMVVRRDLVVLQQTEKGWSAETPVARLVRALLETRRAPVPIAKPGPELTLRDLEDPRHNYIWRAVERALGAENLTDRETPRVGLVRFRWKGSIYEVDSDLDVTRIWSGFYDPENVTEVDSRIKAAHEAETRGVAP